MSIERTKRISAVVAPLLGLLWAFGPRPALAQATPEVPPEMEAVSFLLGEWTVEGKFRTPDHVGADRTLWYVTADGGVTRFDGRMWTAHAVGSSVGDSIRALIPGRADPYEFGHKRTVTTVQDGFAVLIDDGETAGSTQIYFDTEGRAWTSQSIHAPTNAITNAVAAVRDDGVLVFEGEGVDRRGPRQFRSRYEIESADRYRIHTDVSFDDATTWIVDQIVQTVTRSAPTESGALGTLALRYLSTLYELDFDALAHLVAEDLRFVDGTRRTSDGSIYEERGRQQVLTSFERAAAGTRNPGFEVHRQFESAGFVVLSVTYHAELDGSELGVSDGWFPVVVPGITVISLSDGLVTEHVDYVDYDALQAQVAAESARQQPR